MPSTPIACLDGRVLAIEDIGPSFRRITFGGEGLDRAGFPRSPLDLRVKVIIPEDKHAPRMDLQAFLEEKSAEGVSWYQAWLQLPTAQRGCMRTYTVRRWDEDTRELTIDFVLHTDGDGHSGPAARWAMDAEVGDVLQILGPDRRSDLTGVGIEFHPGAATDLLIAGDETAVPAIASILSSLPPECSGCALLEVPQAGDVQRLQAPSGVQVRWLVRDRRRTGELLDRAVREVVRTPLCAVNGIGRVRRGLDQVELEDVDIDSAILWEVPAHDDPADTTDPARSKDTSDRREATGENTRFYAWIAGEAGVV
ncbi:MAG: siderophore-interacting protein, partial [Brachybacterium sp.]|nr:siderophore-interacting protein [Brachybacterium sp.]